MRAAVVIPVCIAIAGCASSADSVRAGVAADGAITAAAVSSGVAAEGNPAIAAVPALGVASIVGRIMLADALADQPEPQRTVDLAAIDAITWGAVASNVLVAIGAATPVGLVVGLSTGAAMWQQSEQERLFAQVCAYERQVNPALRCVYRRQP